MVKRLINNTDEKIELEPGESVDFLGAITQTRTTASKLRRVTIAELK